MSILGVPQDSMRVTSKGVVNTALKFGDAGAILSF